MDRLKSKLNSFLEFQVTKDVGFPPIGRIMAKIYSDPEE